MFGTITPVIECKIPTPTPSFHTFNTSIDYSINSYLYSTKYILIQVSKFICVNFSITFFFLFRLPTDQDMKRRMLLPIKYIETNELRERASQMLTRVRSQPSIDQHSILVPRTEINMWGKNKPYCKTNLMNKFCGYEPTINRGKDQKCMEDYLKVTEKGGMQNPQLESVHNLLPAGAPLLDFLSCAMERVDDWILPGRAEVDFWSFERGITYDILKQVEVKEIIVGRSTEQEIDEITSWFWDQYALDQKILPTHVVSMDVEEIKVTLYDTLRIAGKLPFKKGQLMSRKEEKTIKGQPEDRMQQLPVKIMLGNGLNHALMVSLDLFRDAKGRYILNRIFAPDSIIKFFSLLPICTGVAVKHDVEGLIKFYSLITDQEVTMKGFLEIGSIALVAGYAMQARNMNAIAMQVLGVVMNKLCSTADNLWGVEWNDIPDALKVYAIADLKIGHLAYCVFASIILRDYIPDPEIFLFYIGKFDQWLTADWFLRLLATTLEGTEIHDKSFKSAVSRSDLIRCLRFRYSEDSPLMDEAPQRVLLWVRSLGEWPSLTKGGCRFLHQARSWFVEIVRVWNQQGLRWDEGIRLPQVSAELMNYANFKVSPVQIAACNFREPTSLSSGLMRPLSLKLKALEMDPVTVRSFSIGKLCRKLQRDQFPVLIEWARENPTKISEFLRRMGSDVEFQKFYRHLYDPMRHMFRRIFNCEALTVVFIDGVLLKTIKNKLREESDCTARLREELKVRESRINYFEDLIECGDDTLRARWSEDLPSLPEWVIARQKRSKAKKRPCENPNQEQVTKKVKLDSDSTPQDIETLEPESQSEEEGEVVVYIDQEEEEVEVAVDSADRSHKRLLTVQEELDKATPMRKKAVPFLRKKGKKKKASTPVFFDYAEAIESEKKMFSDDDYTLETEFGEVF